MKAVDGNEIAERVISVFNGLPSHGKPTERSNKNKEWTVLASIVALKDGEIIPICLSTGVKTLPEKVRSYSKGLIVHDLHAEILCFRLFNWYLLEECSGQVEATILVDKTNEGSYKLKDGIKLALFVTEPPCGDSSMSYILNEFENQTVWKKSGEAGSEDTEASKRQKVIRGRHLMDKLGVVRTKPGRADSLLSLCKSCSDKICMKQLTGITNAIAAPLFPKGIFLDYLVLNLEKFNHADMDRCFKKRFIIENLHRLEIIKYDPASVSCFEYLKRESAPTSPLSLLYVGPTSTKQVLNNGVKDGAFSKKKPPRKGGESFICNQRLFDKARSLLQTDAEYYGDFKKEQLERQQLKERGRKLLGNWVATGPDNFKLDR